MAFTPVNPTDPLDQPSHSGLHNQHSTDIEAAQGDIATLSDFMATLAGGEAGEVLAKTTGDDYDYDWLPGGTGGGPGGEYPGISTEDPNGLGLGTDGGLRVEPSDLLSDNAGQQLTVTPDDGKLYFGGLPAVGGGKVLQVVRATLPKEEKTTTNTSWEDVDGMAVTITPTKSTSALLIVATCMLKSQGVNDQKNYTYAYYGITDSANNAISGAQDLISGIIAFSRSAGDTAYVQQPAVLLGYATPATTSAVTYKMRFRVDANTGCIAGVNGKTTTGQMYAIELADVVVSP